MNCYCKLLSLVVVISQVSSFTIPSSSVAVVRTTNIINNNFSDSSRRRSSHLKSSLPLHSITGGIKRATMALSTATVSNSTTLTMVCILAAATWTAYNEGKRRGREEREESVDKDVVDGLMADNEGEDKDDDDVLPVYPIGKLQSIYRLCVGTPRQGMLAPHSRGIITFDETRISKDSILELQNYSHVFVVFVFHLNSNDKKHNKNGQFKGKISPPSLGGKKVGVFSTRTPHRPNPIGFSLCRLDKVIINNKKKGNNNKDNKTTFQLLLSGLDLVDGTPIVDIKPYVPHYDCVGYEYDRQQKDNGTDDVRVPQWVDSGLQKRRSITFLPEATQFLQDLTTAPSSKSPPLKFYGAHTPWKDSSPEVAVEYIKQCILELLSVDVRSAWQTRKARDGKFQAERSSRVKEWKGDGSTDKKDTADLNSSFCTQQIDNLLVQYTIEEPGSAYHEKGVDERSIGSGAEDIVVVHSISLI